MTKLKVRIALLELTVFLLVQCLASAVFCLVPKVASFLSYNRWSFSECFFVWVACLSVLYSLRNTLLNISKNFKRIDAIEDIRITIDLDQETSEEPTPVRKVNLGIN